MQSFCKVNSFATIATQRNFAADFKNIIHALKAILRMKRILLALVMVCSFMSMFAQSQGPVEMTLGRETTDNVAGRHKAPARIPSVSYDDSHVYVVAPFEIECATILIYNEDGEVIYSIVTPLTTTGITLTLPWSVCEERYSLELMYGSMDLVGYF